MQETEHLFDLYFCKSPEINHDFLKIWIIYMHCKKQVVDLKNLKLVDLKKPYSKMD